MARIESQAELEESYDKLWKEVEPKEDLDYYTWILNLLEGKSGQRLLDVACGAGFLLAEAEKRNLETWGIDISQNALDRARKICRHTHFTQGVAEELPYGDEEFDFVTCLGSVEHFLDPERALKEMHRVLKYDGTLCVVLPNQWFLVDFLRGVFDGEGLSHQQSNERFYSLNEAVRLVRANFAIIRREKYNPSVETIRTVKPLLKHGHLFLWLYKRLGKHLPLPASYCFVFVCRKYEAAAPSLLAVGSSENEQFLIEGWHAAEKGPLKVRWAKKQASAYLNPVAGASAICLKAQAMNPDLAARPLTLKVSFAGKMVGQVSINEPKWTEMRFPCHFHGNRGGKVEIGVSRMWNPSVCGLSIDSRDLGIMIEKIWTE